MGLFGLGKKDHSGQKNDYQNLSVEEKYGQAWLLLVAKRVEEGLSILRPLDAANFAEASVAMAMFTTNQNERRQLIKKAADAGNPEALWEYCGLLPHSYCPMTGNPNDDLWVSTCLKAAELGSADAMNEMGNIYHRKGNYAEAMYWYALANAHDHPDGNVGMSGLAKKWAREGAPSNYMEGSPGFSQARFKCALTYLEVNAGMKPSINLDDIVAMVLEGEPIAAYLAGDIFEGIGNMEMAERMYNAIAFENDAHGIKCLADMKYYGKGTNRDVSGAVNLYLKAAQLGERTAMFIMGEFTRGSNKNMAAYWYGLAHTRGYEHALPRLIQLSANP